MLLILINVSWLPKKCRFKRKCYTNLVNKINQIQENNKKLKGVNHLKNKTALFNSLSFEIQMYTNMIYASTVHTLK